MWRELYRIGLLEGILPNMGERLRQAISAIDTANSADPRGKEMVYSQRMTEWLFRLELNPSEALQLAARAQHIRRWEIARNSYPLGRIGYLQWRTALYAHHARIAGEILQSVGCDPITMDHVERLLRKQGIKTDSDMQILEDVACLVFLEYELADFAGQHPEEKVIDILRKTWRKMSSRGHAAAEAILPSLPNSLAQLIARARAE